MLMFFDLAGLTLLAMSFVQTVLAAMMPAIRRGSVPGRPGQALHFTFLIPALNEGRVIGSTVATLRSLAPDAHIAVIDDGSDDDTAAVVRTLSDHDASITLLRRFSPHARQGKGQALNWAARSLLGDLQAAGRDLTREIVVVVDADGRITPELLDEARAAMDDPLVAGAQARVIIRPSGARRGVGLVIGRVLERQQDLEFFVIRSVQRLRHRWRSVGLCGNGQFMRASYLHDQITQGAAAWPDCLAEDFASGLAMRLDAPRHRMVFLEAAVTQQGLPSLRRFLRQRARWAQGTMQCLPYLPGLWSGRVALGARLDLSYAILAPWLNAVIILCLLTQPLRWLLDMRGIILSPALSLTIAVVNIGLQWQWVLRYHRGRGLGAVLFTLVSQPLYGFALSLALPLAYWNHFTGRRTWDKTARHLEPVEPIQAVNGD